MKKTGFGRFFLGSKGPKRGKVLGIDRPDGRKVLKFDGTFGPEGCGLPCGQCLCSQRYEGGFLKRGRKRRYGERSEVGLFSLGQSPVVRFSPPKAAFILAPIRAPTSPAQRCYITTLGEALNPSGRRQPIPDRTLAAQGRKARRLPQPSRRSRVNLREYRFLPFPHKSSSSTNVAHSKKHQSSD